MTALCVKELRMEALDNRKQKILRVIISTYLETGEPVGSRTISKAAGLNVSSATIRNEMADLEEMGYIVQPHTSAGRIPTDKGYRLYVDQMVQEQTQQVVAMNSMIIARTNRMEQVLKQVVKLLAANTNYTSMITAPTYRRNKIKFIQLSRLNARQLLAVIVIEGNVVKNHIVELSESINEEHVLSLNLLLNTNLNGLTLEDINLGIISRMKEEAGEHGAIVSEVLDAVADAIKAENDEEMQIYTSGADNIFKYPELADTEKASRLISTLETKDVLADFIKQTEKDSRDENGIQVYIGEESPVESMQDCSVVTATYDLGGGMEGTIGIIGPKRMDYGKVMENLKTLKQSLSDMFGGVAEKEIEACEPEPGTAEEQ